jgi:hypothetical protein
LWTRLDHGHARTESTECLGQFETHVAATEHDEVFRQSIEIESLHMSHRFGLGETGDSRNGGT